MSAIARVLVERCIPNQQASTSWATQCLKCTRVAKN
jgi:hypothetical protein